jgi:hypothetical protein
LTSPNVSEPFQIAAILASSHELAHVRTVHEGKSNAAYGKAIV